MIKDDLVAERLVIEHYQELIRYFGDDDPTTRIMLEHILADEEDHAYDMHDLPVAHEGTRSEEHTSELQSLMRISSAVFCLKKITDNNYLPHSQMLKSPTDLSHSITTNNT